MRKNINKNLIPTIIQDINTNEVLMLGYSNKKSILKTKQTEKVTFYSRSQKKLWTKGETSGKFLIFKKMLWDCDKDALLIFADPIGPTCHKNNFKNYSCFKNEPDFSLNILEKILCNRKIESENGRFRLQCKSYTQKLLKSEKIIKAKIIEEVNEVVLENGKQRIIEESADLIYHLMVLWVKKNISLKDIILELKKRNKK
ncbi:MAG: bifunctional phosphoribosyl-AMP cyclohydrolase/phosphoribosyl-ATP diphosphatase HisIE [Patescibacteria group bacterium]